MTSKPKKPTIDNLFDSNGLFGNCCIDKLEKEAMEYINFIHKNGSDFNQDEINTLLNMQKNEVLSTSPNLSNYNFYNAEIKDYLYFIFKNGNSNQIEETLDLLFIIKDEIEEKMKMEYEDNGNLIFFPEE